MKALDRSSGTDPETLMEAAGEAVAALAARMVRPGDGLVEVFCGPGNNGGDGFVAARRLRARGYDVRAVFASDSASGISPLCMKNLLRFREDGGTVLGLNRAGEAGHGAALAVDALLGTGAHGPLEGPVAVCVPALSRTPRVLAVDTPTGVDGTSGAVAPGSVGASATLAIAAPKAGLLVPPGCGRTGALFVADIGIPVPARPDRAVLDFSSAAALLPERPVDAHKGTFGRLMLIGGSEDMPGAALLMAMGALRAGCGLVRLWVPYPAAPAVSGRIPEVICGYFLPGDVTSLPDPSGSCFLAMGPGMGAGPDTAKIVRHVLSSWDLPAVMDADALNVLSGSVAELAGRRAPLVLTPHLAELRRLTGRALESREETWETAAVFARATGASILLKGRPSVVFGPDGSRVLIPTGNSGLATGGSGDILTGMIASLGGQGLRPSDAAAVAAFVHGLSADIIAAGTSSRSVLPSDVVEGIGDAFAFLENKPPEGLVRMEGRWHGRLWDLP